MNAASEFHGWPAFVSSVSCRLSPGARRHAPGYEQLSPAGNVSRVIGMEPLG